MKNIIRTEDFIYNYNNKIVTEQKEINQNYYRFKNPPQEYDIIEDLFDGIQVIKYKTTTHYKKFKRLKKNKAILLTISKTMDISKIIDILDDDYAGLNIFAKDEE